MAGKGENTKQRIVTLSRSLFSKKGYIAVTMKDVCEICKLSRGGLYRHFGSTEEIFLEVLERDKNDAEDSINQAISMGLSPTRLIDGFFQLQKNDIANSKNRIEMAVYEFAMANPDQKSYLSERFDSMVRIFAKLIAYGQDKGEFHDGRAEDLGEHMVIFLEGLKLSTRIMSLSKELLDQQFLLLRSMIVRKG